MVDNRDITETETETDVHVHVPITKNMQGYMPAMQNKSVDDRLCRIPLR